MSGAPAPQRSSVDLSTLVIAAIASGAAAYVTSKLWPGGTLISASMTPVIVAIVKEGLLRTSDVTTRRVRDLATGRMIEVEVPREDVEPPPPARDEPFDPLAPVTPPPPTEQRPSVNVHRTEGRRRRRNWRLAVVTGLLAFVIAAAVVTVPQLLANSAGGGGGTTYFGGHSSQRDRDTDKQDKRDATPTATPTGTATPDATATATPETTATPEATTTPEATASPTPTVSPTVTPSVTTAPTP